MTLEQRITDAGGTVRALNSLTHADQIRLADRLGVPVTELHRRVSAGHNSVAPARRSAEAPGVAAARAELARLKRGSTLPATSSTTTADEESAEREWFAEHPDLLQAIDYVSQRVGLRVPADAPPGWRLLALIKRVGEVGDKNRRDAQVSMLDRPLNAAVRRQHELEDAHRSLARQARAVLAAGKRG
jgi:hypothetical protein